MVTIWPMVIVLGVAIAAFAEDATTGPTDSQAARTPEARALAYLAREVPRWSPNNKCFSCHNNGDGARALYTAAGMAYRVDAKVLADTTRWLAHPEAWKDNGGDGEFSDKRLAAIQFASSLVTAVQSGAVKTKAPLVTAAGFVAKSQQQDGSWQIDAPGSVGSPATYGPFLATAMSRQVLIAAEQPRFTAQIASADRWLRGGRPRSMPGAAGVLIGLDAAQDKAAQTQRQYCLELIAKGQDESGGWGPYAGARCEPFDTAIVLIALARWNDRPDIGAMIRRGRRYLIETQLEDGSWLETTRPAESDSYAQRLSTAGWATMALLATRPRPKSARP